jgi:hypothetical protein
MFKARYGRAKEAGSRNIRDPEAVSMMLTVTVQLEGGRLRGGQGLGLKAA